MESAGWSPAFGEHAAEEQEETPALPSYLLSEKQGWKCTAERNASPLVWVTPQLDDAGFVTLKKTNLRIELYLEAESNTAQSQSSSSPRPFYIQRK